MRAKYGLAAEWTPEAEMLACLVDMTRHHRWLDTGKKGPQPRPVQRPGGDTAKGQARVVGRGTSMTPAAFDAWLADQEAA